MEHIRGQPKTLYKKKTRLYCLKEFLNVFCLNFRPLRVCSLCNLAERSLLGQGDICRYEPTPNFNPFKQNLSKLEKKFSPDPEEKEGEKGPKPLTWRRNRGPMKGSRSVIGNLNHLSGYQDVICNGSMCPVVTKCFICMCTWEPSWL